MISVSLMGAMGNQMFQIAAIHALAKRNGFEYGVDLRSYTPLQGFQATKYAENIFKNVPKIQDIEFAHRYNEPQHRFSQLPNQDNMVVQGYFQSELYFEDCKNEIKNLFDVPPLFKYNYDISSIHVRRGDYLAAPHVFPILPLDYYYEAMEVIKGDFIVCSDDIDWCRKNFKGSNIVFSNNNNEIDDLRLMKYCKNNIIANSSFSWWGAWLNPNPNKIVISPKKWFVDGGPDCTDTIPKEWIKL